MFFLLIPTFLTRHIQCTILFLMINHVAKKSRQVERGSSVIKEIQTWFYSVAWSTSIKNKFWNVLNVHLHLHPLRHLGLALTTREISWNGRSLRAVKTRGWTVRAWDVLLYPVTVYTENSIWANRIHRESCTSSRLTQSVSIFEGTWKCFVRAWNFWAKQGGITIRELNRHYQRFVRGISSSE